MVWLVISEDDYRWVSAAFDNENAAKDTAEEGQSIMAIGVRSTPLRTQYRWRAAEKYRRWGTDGLREVESVKRYRINEFNPEWDAGLRHDSDYYLNAYTAPAEDEARKALLEEIAPWNEQESKRLAYLATCTETFYCPDHGELPGKHPLTSQAPCIPCGRWVDARGVRFGRYESGRLDPESMQFTISFSAGGDAPEEDQGPLPDGERRLKAGTE